RRLGFEVRRTGRGGPRHTLPEVLAQVRSLGLEPGTVIDVGVAWGTAGLYEAFPGARHLLVEPLAEYEGALRKIAERHGADYVLAAAGAQAGETEIAVHRVPTLSSSLGGRAGAGRRDRVDARARLRGLRRLRRPRAPARRCARAARRRLRARGRPFPRAQRVRNA